MCLHLIIKALKGSFSVDFNATIDTQTEHTRAFKFSIKSIVQL